MRTKGSLIIQNRSETSVKVVKIIFIVFYSVGIIGLTLPFSFPIFSKLFPFALLLSFAGILLFHQHKADLNTAIVFAGIFVLGFAIEAIGVNFGFIFGEYWYGKSLGFKIFKTPLIIGLNWLLLVYMSASIINRLRLKPFFSIFLASLSMLGYDIILEQTAPRLDMWHWVKDIIPLHNYIAWFLIALVMHLLLKISGVKTENKIAPVIFLCQLAFFTCLFIFYSLIK